LLSLNCGILAVPRKRATSVSPLSSQIRKLEDELGVKLLERTNKRVDMTPVGSQILNHAQKALAEAKQMETVARAARDPLVGPLKLGVIPTLAPY
jgi:LysR family transcriptional regulator, hydrogen peroxide-inducible genes activator